jgi:16S rRNA (uracil1498-N3)-methyltransferase
MPRIYLPAPSFPNNQISITGEKARYLASVLRCRKGDSLIIFDGEGTCFRTVIAKADKREVIAELKEKSACSPESPVNIIFVQGILKGEKMDIAVQKTTELGVNEIWPVVTERSQLKETNKVARWRRIAEEASRQSCRNVVPVVHEIRDFHDVLASNATCIIPRGLIFYEEEGIKLSETVPSFACGCSSLMIVIGPEGGFAREEIDFAKDRGLLVTSLGQRILRAETAAISAVTLVQFLFGDLS